ncbi:unnamed protein product [Allacma fusca]|uniref:Uncharacterized protein n=1 Tax=Allacma fusca TaxID=39272 RepID=A0A8J2MGT6_9HEXA|nr:unnamed protein product [Allacma fusca]
MLQSIFFIFMEVLLSTNGHFRNSNTLYMDEWINFFSSCRIEIYTDSLTELSFLQDAEPIPHPLVLTKNKALNPEDKICSLSRHIDQCHANLLLPYPERTIKQSRFSKRGFIKSFLPATQHYHFVTDSSHVKEEINVMLKLKTEVQERAEYTHVVLIILKEKYIPGQTLDTIKFDFWMTVCFSCQARSVRKLYNDADTLWKETHANGQRKLDGSYLDQARKELLKKVPHGVRLFQERVLLNFIGPQTGRFIPKVLSNLIQIIQTQFSNSSLLLKHPHYETVSRHYPKNLIQKLPSINYKLEVFSSSSIFPVQLRYFNFISCVELEETTEMKVYLDPFDLHLWIGLGISCLTFGAIFWGLSGRRIPVLESLLLVLSVLLENCQIPSYILKRGLIRSLIGLCLMFSIIVENSYKGKITASVTAPKPRKQLETFEDLEGFNIYSPVARSFKEFTVNASNWKLVKDNKLLQSVLQDPEMDRNRPCLTLFGWQLCLRYGFIRKTISKLVKASEVRRLIKMVKFPENFPTVSVEEEVSKCNKSAFVDYEDTIDEFVPVLRNIQTPIFTKGKEKFLKAAIGWAFQNEKKSGGLLSKFIQPWISESGIYRWMEFQLPGIKRNSLRHLMEIQSKQVKICTLSWRSNLIAGLLYITLTCLCISWIVIFLEIWLKRGLRRNESRDKVELSSSKNCPIIVIHPDSCSQPKFRKCEA